ncbi:hypothetical protein BBP40_009087 [Aspergillus hancockii]|nr:hypothetical protein BBP40_009087 [Aspergillus hancockii]
MGKSPTVLGQINATYDLGCFAGAILCVAYGDRCRLRLSILLGGAMLNIVLNQLGNVSAQWLNFGLGSIGDQDVSWWFPIAFQIFCALATVIMIPWLPESPRWLIQKGRSTEAHAVIARLYGQAPHDPEMVITRDSCAIRRSCNGGVSAEMVRSAAERRAADDTACAAFIESVGRKRLMVWDAVGQGICFALMAGGLGTNQDKWSVVAVSFVFMFYTVFGLS